MWARPLHASLDGAVPFARRSSAPGFSLSLWHSQAPNAALREHRLPSRWLGSGVARRGKKTRTTIKLEDLPQGLLIPLEPSKSTSPASLEQSEDATVTENESPAYPTVVLQAQKNMRKFSNCVLLTRVGSFYELYFEHAEEFGPLLNLKVAQKKTSAGPVPMVNNKSIPLLLRVVNLLFLGSTCLMCP